MTQTISYEITGQIGEIEFRKYPRMVLATVLSPGNDSGFNLLFSYITGKNRTKRQIQMTAPVITSEKIAMTAPVNMQQTEGKYAVSFLMPSRYTLETLPEPLDESVVIKELPPQKIAAIRYSGTWSQERYEAKKTSLEEFLQTKGLVSTGEPVFARYNPPFELWFLRRNEVLIPVE